MLDALETTLRNNMQKPGSTYTECKPRLKGHVSKKKKKKVRSFYQECHLDLSTKFNHFSLWPDTAHEQTKVPSLLEGLLQTETNRQRDKHI